MAREGWSERHVCVTGGSGVIGRRLVRRLLRERPARIVSLSRSGSRDLSDGVVNCVGNVLEPDALKAALEGCSVVVHLAAEKHLNPAAGGDAADVNLGGTAAVVDACEALGIQTLVYASTAYVYKPDGDRPMAEDSPTGPLSAYAISKLAGERLVARLGQQRGFTACIARIANVYDGEPNPSTVIGQALSQVRTGRLAFRDLTPVRDFIHVDDVVEALLLFADMSTPGCTVMNVSTGVGTSIGGVADMLADASVSYGFARPVVMSANDDVPPDPIPLLVLQNAKLRTLTSWTPAVSLKDGIHQALSRLQCRDLVH